MGRDKRFHNLIEQENAEEKERVWANIRKVDTFTLVEEREKERIFRKSNWLSVIVSSLLLIVITIFCNVNNPISKDKVEYDFMKDDLIYVEEYDANANYEIIISKANRRSSSN